MNRIYICVMLSLTVFGMSAVCYKLCSTLNHYYPNFYKKQRCYIVSMSVGLITSCTIRLGNQIWRALILGGFTETLNESALDNNFVMPLYYICHFITIDLLSAGTMLVNFGFALKNRTEKEEEKK